jgi:hypothetical protein
VSDVPDDPADPDDDETRARVDDVTVPYRPPCIEGEGDTGPVLGPTGNLTERRRIFETLPQPLPSDAEDGSVTADWNSVALFFNLPRGNRPGDYSTTTTADAKAWLDEGGDPSSPTVSEFMTDYWGTLSYGELAFGVDTPRDEHGDPLVPTISGVSSGNWQQLIKDCLDANAAAIWEAAGGLYVDGDEDGKPWIPSVVLVQNYSVTASAGFSGFDHTVGGTTYRVGDQTHVTFDLGNHRTEDIGYVAAEATGSGPAGTVDGVTDDWSTGTFDGTHAERPVVVGSLQTFEGSDTAGLRMRSRSPADAEVAVEEERSMNAETDHVPETVGYLAVEDGEITDSDGVRIGEAGTVRTDQSDSDEWHSVSLDAGYADPVVLAQVMSYEGTQPAHTRLRDVGTRSFEFQIEEWDYQNQRHVTESVGYVVLESGDHELPDGTDLSVGTVETDLEWEPVSLSGLSDGSDPVVLSHAQTRRGNQAVVTRQRDASADGFGVRLQEEEANNRRWWGSPLAHEYAHNFLEFGDLYSPTGATLYWDLLGDGSVPAKMSEVSSVHKERVGWLEFTEVVEGSSAAGYANEFSLEPYTTSGDAVKVVPDPENNPHEYFVVEFRGPTGEEVWRPDRALSESGLLITHVNERILSLTSGDVRPAHMNWFLSEAPYFDPEFADYSHEGGPLRGTDLKGALFTGESGRNLFAPHTEPSSDFYGGRSSTLSISDITVEDGSASFWLDLDPIDHERLWECAAADRGVAGRFTSDDPEARDEVFFRDDDAAALLAHDETKWFVRARQEGRIDGWNLGSRDRELVGDFDGDGREEIYVRSDGWAGIFRWAGERFEAPTVVGNEGGDWTLTARDDEVAADLDGDGRDEILALRDDGAAVLSWDEGFDVAATHGGTVGEYSLSPRDTAVAGRFTGSDGEEVVVVGDDGLALVGWEETAGALDTAAVHPEAVGDWTLGADDDIAVADLDGDGLDELYVRKTVASPAVNEAAVLSWDGDGFESVWHRTNDLKGLENTQNRLTLGSEDRSYGGRFLPHHSRSNRGGIAHVADDRVSLLSWDDDSDELRVESFEQGGWFDWTGETGLVLGDFHRTGPETSEDDRFVTDEGTDLFLHNEWGTGTMGVDVRQHQIGGADVRSFDVFWRQPDYLMSQYEPSLVADVRNDQPVDVDETVEFVATPRGVDDVDDWSIEWAYRDGDGNHQRIGTSDPGAVFEFDGFPVSDTGPGSDGHEIVGIRARATRGGETLTDRFTVEFRPNERTRQFDATQTLSGALSSDGTVVPATETDTLPVGDDAENVSTQAMLTFDLALPEDLSPSGITDATLNLVLRPPEGDPYGDLFELSAVHVDYGDAIEPSDYRTKSLRLLPGRSVVPFENGWGGRQVDVTRAVRHAWETRADRDDRVQFVLYHSQGTDDDSTADYSRLAADDPDGSSHNSLLQVRYDTEN